MFWLRQQNHVAQWVTPQVLLGCVGINKRSFVTAKGGTRILLPMSSKGRMRVNKQRPLKRNASKQDMGSEQKHWSVPIWCFLYRKVKQSLGKKRKYHLRLEQIVFESRGGLEIVPEWGAWALQLECCHTFPSEICYLSFPLEITQLHHASETWLL